MLRFGTACGSVASVSTTATSSVATAAVAAVAGSSAARGLATLSNKAFIVTGAGSGLGQATAEALAAEGAGVTVVDMNAEHGQAVADAIGGIFVQADVSSEDDVKSAVAATEDKFGTINGAVNCAGIAIAKKVLSSRGAHPLEDFRKVIEVNLLGSWNVIRLTADAMTGYEPDGTGERGCFVSTASVAAFDGQIGQSAYTASKGGVHAMTLPLARELREQGIRVNTIAPGIFGTPMLMGLPEKARESLAQQVPFPSRLGDPAEYAKLVVHIMTNQYLNGETIRLDGAIRMAPK